MKLSRETDAERATSMTLNLPLTPDLEQRLAHEAARQGLAPVDYTLQLLNQHLPPPVQRSELIALVQSWIDAENPEEQKETGDYLVRALDEDRPSDRKLFPPELEGVTW